MKNRARPQYRENREGLNRDNYSPLALKGSTIASDYEILIPTAILTNRSISSFEAIVIYLKEEFRLKYSEIANLTGRDQRNIWTIYNRAIRKIKPVRHRVENTFFPLSTLKETTTSPLEAIIEYLKLEQDLTISQIARLLLRSPKTIWTVYQRVRKKHRKKPKN